MTRREFSTTFVAGTLGLRIIRAQGMGSRYEDLFSEICKAIDQQFYDPAFLGIDWERVKREFRARVTRTNISNDADFLALAKEMLRQLPTSHLTIRPPDSGVKVGVAVASATVEDRDTIISVDQASDAQRVGLRQGDVLLGKPEERSGIPGSVAEVAVEKCNGQVASLRIRREPANWPPKRPWVRWRKVMWDLKRSIGYMEIVRFDDGAALEIDQAMSEMKDTVGLIIDIRGNEGGNLSFLRLTSYLTGGPRFTLALLTRGFLNRFGAAPELLNEATIKRIPHEKGLYTTRDILEALQRNGGGGAFYTEDVGDREYQGQVVVLTSGRTASAAEGFAWSVKGKPRVTLVGRPTAGAVVGSESVPMPWGWKLILPTHAAWGPDGKLFRDTHILPDVSVPVTRADLCNDVDADLKKALELLASRIQVVRSIRLKQKGVLEEIRLKTSGILNGSML